MDDETFKSHVSGIFDRAASNYDAVGPRFLTYFAEQLVTAARLASGANLARQCADGRTTFANRWQ